MAASDANRRTAKSAKQTAKSDVRATAKKRAKKATPHDRTRADHATELAEDYVEAISELADEAGYCRAVDLAERFGVSHVTVSRTIKRLLRDGYVDAQPYAPVTLTAKGRRVAAASRERHQTVLQFLRAIGVSERTAAIDAEGMEHHVSPETLRKMRAFTESQGDS